MDIALLALAFPIIGYIVWDSLGVILSLAYRYRQRKEKATQASLPHVAILYPTCDDFDPQACATLLRQTGVSFDLFILDDSTKAAEREHIGEWGARQSTKITIVRRQDRQGFKGGNINNWLTLYGDPCTYPHFLLVDADEHLPQTFTKELLRRIAGTNYAFVQGLHFATSQLETFFQKSLNLQVTVDQIFQLPAWNYKGIAPLIGHGVILNTEHVHSVGGFPEVVSEDLALSIALAEKGLHGRGVPDVVAKEVFPKSYAAYWSRRRRWVQADTEMLRKFMGTIWQSRLNLTGKISMSIRELRLPILTTYWVLCAVLAFGGIFGSTTTSDVSSWWWLAMPLLFFPSWPALTLSAHSLARRVLYLMFMPVVGLASIGIAPLAVMTGFKKQLRFDPTGSRTVTSQRLFDGWLLWEIASGILFIIGGLMGGNWLLSIIGLTTFSSPFLRTKLEIPVLLLLTTIFWITIGSVIMNSLAVGHVPLGRFILILGLTIM